VSDRGAAEPKPAGATVSAAAGHIVLVLAAGYWLARWGFETPSLPVLRAAGLGLFLASGGELARTWARRYDGQWFASEGWLGLCPLLIAAPLGAALPVAWGLLSVLGLLGFGLAVIRAHAGRGGRVAWVAAAVLMGCWFAGMAWGHGYANPLFVEGLATSALHKTTVDTLFHSTIASMVELQGVASTGLDGVLPLSYHVASHWLLAWLGRLCGVAPFDFYQLGYPVVILPAMWAALLRLGLALRSRAAEARPGWAFWGVAVAGMIGFLPLEAQRAVAIGWWRPVSESYGVSLVIGLSLLSTLVACYRSLEGRALAARDWSRHFFLLLILPVLLAATAFAKSSTAMLMLVGGAFALWRLRLYRNRWWLACALLTAVVSLFVLSMVKIPGFATLRPLAFLRSYVQRDAIAVWPLAYFAWLWLLIALRTRALEPAMTLRSLLARLRAGELFDLELVCVIAVVASLPDAILAIPGQSGGYFSDLHRWLALAFLLALAARPGVPTTEPPVAERRVSTLGAVAIAAVLVGVVLGNTALLLQRVVRTNLAIRRALLPRASLAQLLGRSGALRQAALADPTLQMLEATRSAARAPRAERLKTGLIAPPAPAELSRVFGECELPFVWTALSGLPLVGGLPERQCQYFGYWSYERRPGGWDGPGKSLSGCERAQSWGFTSVLRVVRDSRSTRLERERCEPR